MAGCRRIGTEAGCSLHGNSFDVARRTLDEMIVRRIADWPFSACEHNEQVVRGTSTSPAARPTTRRTRLGIAPAPYLRQRAPPTRGVSISAHAVTAAR